MSLVEDALLPVSHSADSEVTCLAGIKSVTISNFNSNLQVGAFVEWNKTKLDGVEAGADVR